MRAKEESTGHEIFQCPYNMSQEDPSAASPTALAAESAANEELEDFTPQSDPDRPEKDAQEEGSSDTSQTSQSNNPSPPGMEESNTQGTNESSQASSQGGSPSQHGGTGADLGDDGSTNSGDSDFVPRANGPVDLDEVAEFGRRFVEKFGGRDLPDRKASALGILKQQAKHKISAADRKIVIGIIEMYDSVLQQLSTCLLGQQAQLLQLQSDRLKAAHASASGCCATGAAPAPARDSASNPAGGPQATPPDGAAASWAVVAGRRGGGSSLLPPPPGRAAHPDPGPSCQFYVATGRTEWFQKEEARGILRDILKQVYATGGAATRPAGAATIGKWMRGVIPVHRFPSPGQRERVKQELLRAGVDVVDAPPRRSKVALDEVPQKYASFEKVREVIDHTLEKYGQAKLQANELSHNPKRWLARPGRGGRGEEDSARAFLFLSERARRALHHKAGDRLLLPDSGFAVIGVRDIVAPRMCFRCSRYADHSAANCPAPAPTCMACGGVEHETRQCKRTLPRAAIHCTACLGRGHRAFETRYCPAWRDAHAAAEQELSRLLAPPLC